MSVGGNRMSDRPRPDQLWQQAHDEFPNDDAGRRIRYIALMREHGHIVPTIDGGPRKKLFDCEGDADSSLSAGGDESREVTG